MALTTEEQKLLDFALGALPSWYREQRDFEFDGACAKLFRDGQEILEYWFDQSLITQAVGATGFDPDWLNQHAVDRGTTRSDGEADTALRTRIRGVPDALTRPTLLSAAQDIVDAESIVGTVAIVELRRERAFLADLVTDSGTGGTVTAPDANGDQTFEPDVAYVRPPFRGVEEERNFKLVISGAADANHDGTHVIDALVSDSAQFNNPTGSASVDATASWEVRVFDRGDNRLDGFADAYLSRGDRMGSGIPVGIVVILPFGCTSGTESSIREMLRQKKGAGVKVLVECRTSP